jgi:hypothetical protein
MAVTPLIKPVQNRKGIFYNFQSALEDVNITLSNSENQVRFSKFALLRLPNIGEPAAQFSSDNKLQFLALGETSLIEGLDNDQSFNLATSFQNYALNLEALLLSQNGYQRSEKLTVAERVFFKWLKELGAIRFQNANSLEKNTAVLGTAKRYVEASETNTDYEKVVKYIGDIDIVNSLKAKENSYTEVYIHVPTNVGSTTHVLFKSVSDVNYYAGQSITNNPSDPLNIEYLSGRKYDETHPFGISLKAYYDLDDSSIATTITDDPLVAGSPGNWFTNNTPNTYYTDDDGTGSFDSTKDQYLIKTDGTTTISYVRSTLDGISIDFDLNNYKLASENPNIKVFSQFNDYIGNKDFEFNAILVYYDTYDPNNLDSTGAPLDFRTNLYGILILDQPTQNGLEFAIPSFEKYKPDPLNKINGNSFGYKMNLKLDTSAEEVKTEKSINDYSTFSLDLFTDVLTQFKKTQILINDQLLEMQQLSQDVESLKNKLINSEDKTELSLRISDLETSLTENQAIFDNTSAIMGLIESLNDRVDSLITGTTNALLTYDLNVIRPGEGIVVDRSTPGRVRIVNSNQKYNISNSSLINIIDNNTLTLSNFTNYYRHQNSSIPIMLVEDNTLYIDDTQYAWKKGQTVRLVISDEIDLGVYNLTVKTDAVNRKNSGVYGKTIGVLTSDDFGTDGTPIFELICVNDENYTFVIDKIR